MLVNKLTSTFLQICGGLIVLMSLDGNLGLFKQQGLVRAFLAYAKEFPRIGDKGISLGSSAVSISLTGSAKLSVGRRQPITLEERVAELEQKLKEEVERLRKLETSTASRLSELQSELSKSIDTIDGRLRQLSDKVEHTALGGLKQQLFGVLLAVYGAGIGVYA
ncbi:MAG: hypothetical protein V4795_00865 [Pseudomonadota bacterium]